jgi:hypothetical protein
MGATWTARALAEWPALGSRWLCNQQACAAADAQLCDGMRRQPTDREKERAVVALAADWDSRKGTPGLRDFRGAIFAAWKAEHEAKESNAGGQGAYGACGLCRDTGWLAYYHGGPSPATWAHAMFCVSEAVTCPCRRGGDVAAVAYRDWPRDRLDGLQSVRAAAVRQRRELIAEDDGINGGMAERPGAK